MEKLKKYKDVLMVTAMGVVFGLFFPLFTYMIRDSEEGLYFVICTAPLFLGGFAFLIGLYKFKAQSISEDLKKEARSLEREKIMLKTILDHIPNMIFAKDYQDHLKFSHLNKSGERLLGIKEADVLGKSDYDFFPPDQASAFVAKDREVFLQHKPTIIEKEPIETPLGTRWLRTIKVPIYKEDGTPDLLIGFSTDITQELEIQRKLVDLNEACKVLRNKVQGPVKTIMAIISDLGRYKVEDQKFESDLVELKNAANKVTEIINDDGK